MKIYKNDVQNHYGWGLLLSLSLILELHQGLARARRPCRLCSRGPPASAVSGSRARNRTRPLPAAFSSRNIARWSCFQPTGRWGRPWATARGPWCTRGDHRGSTLMIILTIFSMKWKEWKGGWHTSKIWKPIVKVRIGIKLCWV